MPVGGGGAWPGFEIDHSEQSSRVAISRAGRPRGGRKSVGAAGHAASRRPPAHTAARPNKTGHAAAGNLSGQQATPDDESTKVQTHSTKTVVFGCLSPNGSALWQQQRSRPRPRRHLAGELHYTSVFSACRTCPGHQSGGIALQEAPTRRRHAANRLRVVQNPHGQLIEDHCNAQNTRPGQNQLP